MACRIPPGRVGGELVTLGVVELLDRTDEAEVALLDQVEEEHAAAGVALGQRDDQAQVRLEQVVLGAAAVLGDPLEVDALVRGQPEILGQLLLGEQARLDPLGQLNFLFGVEQRHLADLLQVVLDRVGGGAGHRDLRGREVVIVVAEDEGLVVAFTAFGGGLGRTGGLPGHGGRDRGDGRVRSPVRRVVGGGVLGPVGVLGVVHLGVVHLGFVGVGRAVLVEFDDRERLDLIDGQIVEIQLALVQVVGEAVRIVKIDDGDLAGKVGARDLRAVTVAVAIHRHRPGSVPVRGSPRLLLRRRPGALPRRGVSAHHHGHPFLRWLAACMTARRGPHAGLATGTGAFPACVLRESGPPARVRMLGPSGKQGQHSPGPASALHAEPTFLPPYSHHHRRQSRMTCT